MNAANAIGQQQVGIGNAQAAGYMGMANAIGGGAQGISNSYLLSQLLNQNGNINSVNQQLNALGSPYNYNTMPTNPAESFTPKEVTGQGI